MSKIGIWVPFQDLCQANLSPPKIDNHIRVLESMQQIRLQALWRDLATIQMYGHVKGTKVTGKILVKIILNGFKVGSESFASDPVDCITIDVIFDIFV
jgi:hypothetical protein